MGNVISPRKKRSARVRIRVLISLALACCVFPASAYRVCDVVDYGAVGDGATQNIVAIRAALADCSDATEESAALSGGGLFVGAPFNLSSHMVLEVLGTLRGTTNVSLVPLMAPFPSMGGDITRRPRVPLCASPWEPSALATLPSRAAASSTARARGGGTIATP